MLRSSGCVLSCGLAALLIAALPATAGATWSEPVTLSTPGMAASALSVAMNRSNVAAATWAEAPDSSVTYTSDYRIFAGVAQPGASFKVSQLGVGLYSTVAVGPQGQVLVVLFDKASNELRAVFRPSGGSFGTPFVLEKFTSDDSTDAFAGFDASGVATVLWSHGPTAGRLRTRGADGTWSAVQSLDQAGPLGDPVAALAANGDLAVATYKDATHLVVARRAGSTGAISYQTISSSQALLPRQVETDDAGDMTLLVTTTHTPYAAWIADRPAGGTFGAYQALGGDGGGWPKEARDPGGDLFVYALSGSQDIPDRWRTRPAGAASLDAGAAIDPLPGGQRLSGDAGGTAYLATKATSARTDQPSIIAYERSPGGTVSGPIDVSFPDGLYSEGISLASGAGGHAILGWERHDQTWAVQVAVRTPGPDRPPPPPRPLPAQPAPLDHSANYQADPAHTGNLAGVGLRTPLTRDYAIPFPAVSYVNPVIDGSRLFVPNYDGSNVTAFDLATGKQAWVAPIAESNRRTLAASGGVVYVAGGDGTMMALDEATGHVLWNRSVATRLTEPVVADGKVFSEDEFQGGVLYALHTADGSAAWPAQGDFVAGPVTVGGGQAFTTASQAYASGYRASDGARLWGHYTGVTGGGDFSAFDGSYLWAYESDHRGTIYDTATGVAVKALHGDEIPALRAPYAYLLRDGGLEAVDEQTYASHWRFAPPDPLETLPLIVDGVVYAASQSGMLYGLDPATGTVVWSEDTGNTAPLGQYGLLTLAAGAGHLVVNTGAELVVYHGAPEPPPQDPPATGSEPPPPDTTTGDPQPPAASPAGEPASSPGYQADSSNQPAQPATPADAGRPAKPAAARLVGQRVTLSGGQIVLRLSCPGRAAPACSALVRAATPGGRVLAARRATVRRGTTRHVRLTVRGSVPRRLIVWVGRHRSLVAVEQSGLIVLRR